LYDQLNDEIERKDMNFVIARLSDFDMSNEKYPHWTMIRNVQEKVGDSNLRFAWINMDDLNDGVDRKVKEIQNDLNMSKDGYVTLGKRFAEKSIELIEANK
jgi:hypothetical protein